MRPDQDGDRWQPLTIDERSAGGRVVITVSGEVDLASVGELRDALARAVKSRPAAVWLDLSEVEFMDSTGLTTLVLAHRNFDDPDRRFAVICPDGPVRRLLTLAGLDRFVRVHDDEAQARAAG
jgi:anti-sigma B factor antagonist